MKGKEWARGKNSSVAAIRRTEALLVTDPDSSGGADGGGHQTVRAHVVLLLPSGGSVCSLAVKYLRSYFLVQGCID